MDDSFVFVQLDAKPMGNALLSLVQMHMQAGGALDELVILLGEMRDALLKQGEEDDALWKKQNQTCTENIETFSTELDDAENQIETSTESLESLRPSLEEVQNEIETNKKDLKTYEDEQSESSSKRQAEHETWEKNDADYSDAIAAVEEAIALMKQLKTDDDTSFVQIGLKNLETRIQRGLHASSRVLFGAAVTSLAEMATTADQALVAKIIGLLDEIRRALLESQEEDRDNEDIAQEQYDEYNKNLQDEIDSLKTRISEQETIETQLKEKIELEEDTLDAARVKQETYSKLLSDQEAQCDAWKSTYDTNSANRSGELDILNQVIQIVDERIVTMEGYLNERVNV
eukprot:CAMPEP_0204918944 /NCGR_PEP_ID=MMETSP1397-20131031/16540_1 /ASSEMBLY_ACC=CAM_ASM_000891 /TAXON_ID=49980 /ORGANISM="Climacostomum Climacostomum virens, Strain Stock W-24" /LENGTH=344 /DNA_ID=CAMNT_0052092475 /DNA_START=64 /DNA_END=1098 /DNA_ORIENTATION=+